MKILLLDNIPTNSGPSNVHRKFLEFWPKEDHIEYVPRNGKIEFIIKATVKGLGSDLILTPCLNMSEIVAQRILQCFGKPIVVFNHGYAPFENEINNIGHEERWLDAYRNALRKADCIVANSSLQASFICCYQPELANKVKSILLGVDMFDQLENHSNCSTNYEIAVSGGSRFIKGNDVVVRACDILSQRGIDCSLRIYGRYCVGDSLFSIIGKCGRVKVMNQVDHKKFIHGLNQCSLFVMNSRHESFGLSALDALEAGCSVLFSKNCGVLEVLKTNDCDVVEDCEDADEVARKMAYLLEHPNAERLYNTINFENISWKVQTGRLRNVCWKVEERRKHLS